MSYTFKLGGAPVPFELFQVEGEAGKTRLALRSRYDPALVAEVKALRGARWDRTARIWTFEQCQRNLYALRIWTGDPAVRARYDEPLEPVAPRPVPGTRFEDEPRPCKPYQLELMVPHFLQRRRCILAGEQGIGKTLAVIEALERLRAAADAFECWYVCQRNAFDGVWDEWRKWEARVQPRWFTYDALRIFLAKQPPDFQPPTVVVFDESAHLKNPSAARAAAALQLQERMEEVWGWEQTYVWLMSGVPAPQDPTDWWCQAEIAQPGFLREADRHRLLDRIAIHSRHVEREARAEFEAAQKRYEVDQDYPAFEAASLKFAEALKPFTNPTTGQTFPKVLEWKVGEIELLKRRLDGLVLRMSKAEYRRDLPPKVHRVIRLPYTLEDLELAEAVAMTAPTASKAAIDLRTLSDGFRYVVGAGGEREIVYAGSPKEQALREELAAAALVSPRFVVFAGFQGSVDLCTRICRGEGWAVIQVDGRARLTFDLPPGAPPSQRTFLDLETYPQKIAWVANAGAGGMGQTLVTSPAEFFYSNGFKGGDRAQAEDRIHREGAFEEPTIIDCYWLPTDEYVHGVLKDKGALSDLTTSDVLEVLRAARARLEGQREDHITQTKVERAAILGRLEAAREDMPCQRSKDE